MTLTILDPCTGTRVTIAVPTKPRPQRSRRMMLRELDQIADEKRAGGGAPHR